MQHGRCRARAILAGPSHALPACRVFTPAGVQKCQVYTVKAGDTGDKISGMFGVDLSEVEALNPNVRRQPCIPCLPACPPASSRPCAA